MKKTKDWLDTAINAVLIIGYPLALFGLYLMFKYADVLLAV